MLTSFDTSDKCKNILEEENIGKVGFCITDKWNGDAGSPAIIEIYGEKNIIGFSKDQTVEDGTPFYFLNVENFIDWIEKKSNQQLISVKI